MAAIQQNYGTGRRKSSAARLAQSASALLALSSNTTKA